MKKIIIIIIVFSGIVSANAQSIDAFFNKSDAFFKTNVSNGKVAYSKIHQNSNALNALLKIAEGISVSKNDANIYQAFWINAYNLAVIKGIVDAYPTKSPLDQKGFFDKTLYNLGGGEITLNTIENKMLRAQFKDPRFHFVLVCGAVGCPPLISGAYLPNTLNKQLETQTRKAINGSFIKLNSKNKQVAVSQIMEWYKEDFTMNEATEIDFINTYRTNKIPNDFKVSYFPYDWNLNKQ
ncbi:DUF547 domain-containing protein [uncultured Algibacter sp.]|uniref:DUF547 domain-containing protein n=1 Tax=uncultured Algibacter sp. TaxID=298659 RepID=UPI002624487A|nr:DUF547 domain-containing protein [uncultured Algibacter sp.]